ncbi:uncharacterized protein LOC119609899 isoform X1 [Lucilia sericata]|uniref:uncharacterized protein LOC119609899 isoform X1 n=1 Tax=Lucilia sericata TaxID=13632 RepID=UPI0018A87FC4|nr:uncharacterized protein LOC119609899 isoform X1 [Lucilia sericata]
MFNTLVYIPTILAYTFITLLVVILGFIVIYVSHKIYTTVYDNLPVAQLASKSSLSHESDIMTDSHTMLTQVNKTDGLQCRKSKTALRIIVTLEPCYLAYMVFESKLLYNPNNHFASRLYQYSRSSNTSQVSQTITGHYDHYLIKYFDSLSSLPTLRDLQKCDNFKFNKICIRRRSSRRI